MKRKTTTITEEYDADGNLVNKTTETTEEEDTGYIYPQYPYYPTVPTWPQSGEYKPGWVYTRDVTCNGGNYD